MIGSLAGVLTAGAPQMIERLVGRERSGEKESLRTVTPESAEQIDLV